MLGAGPYPWRTEGGEREGCSRQRKEPVREVGSQVTRVVGANTIWPESCASPWSDPK